MKFCIGQVVQGDVYVSEKRGNVDLSGNRCFVGVVIEWALLKPSQFLYGRPVAARLKEAGLPDSMLYPLQNLSFMDQTTKEDLEWLKSGPEEGEEVVYCVVLRVEGGYRPPTSPLGLSRGLQLVNQKYLRPGNVIDDPFVVKDPEYLSKKLPQFDFQCGRYFTKRAENGSHYIANAATRARFPDACVE